MIPRLLAILVILGSTAAGPSRAATPRARDLPAPGQVALAPRHAGQRPKLRGATRRWTA
ncbi:MAG: hypothetical protein IPP62_18990 [bacterium]|nr:hypothetical protein [bacterium]